MPSVASTYIRIVADFGGLRAEAVVAGAEAGRAFGKAFKTEVEAIARNIKLDVVPNLDTGSFRKQWQVFKFLYLRDQRVNIVPMLDGTAFRRQWQIFRLLYLRNQTVNVSPSLSHAGFVSNVTNIFNMAGDSAGKSFSKSFSGGFTKPWQLIVAGIVASLPLLQPLISVLGSIVQAAGAVGAALPLMIATIALPVATLVVAFKGLGDAVKGAFAAEPTKAQQEALANLSGSAREFVRILTGTKSVLKGFRDEVQENFFAPFVGGFKELVNSPFLSHLRDTMSLIANDAGRAGAAIAVVFAESANSGQLSQILGGIRGTFADLVNLGGPLTKMFLTLMAAAQPFVDILKNQLVNSLNKLMGIVEESSKSGALGQFFQDGAQSILVLLRLLGSLGSIFKSVFDGITGGGDGALASIGALAGKFAEFLKSAQGQEILGVLADKLATIGQVVEEVILPLIPFALLLIKTFTGPLTAAIQTILPALGNLIRALVEGFTPILVALAPIIERLAVQFSDFIIMAVRELQTHIEKALPFLIELAQKLGPQMIPLVEAFGDALLALVPIIPAISQFIIELLPSMIALIPVFEFLIRVLIASVHFGTGLITWIIDVIAWFGKMADPIEVWIGIWNATVAWFTGTIAPSFMKALDDIGGFFSKLWESLKQIDDDLRALWDGFTKWFFETIVASLKQALEDIGGFFSKLWRSILKIDDDLKALWNGTIRWFKDNFVAPIQELVTNTIPHAFRKGVDNIEIWWNRLRQIAASPVKFFIQTVVNEGIIGTFNKVADWLPGLNKVTPFNLPAGFHSGGKLPGSPSDVDNMVARGPDGRPIGLAGGEWVVNARQSRKHSGLLHAINAGMDGFADGGIIGAILDPAGWVKDRISGLIDKIPGGGKLAEIGGALGRKFVDSMIKFVKESLFFGGGGEGGGPGPGFPAWGQTPKNGGFSGDSGVWRSIMALVRATGLPYKFGNAYRPGDPLWHGAGRAVDLMGYNQDALATYFLSLRPMVLELIHRTNARDYGITRGRISPFHFQWPLHENHIHIAMAEGGMVADGGGFLRPGWNPPVYNGTGRMEAMVPDGMAVGLTPNTVAAIGVAVARALAGGISQTRQTGRAY